MPDLQALLLRSDPDDSVDESRLPEGACVLEAGACAADFSAEALAGANAILVFRAAPDDLREVLARAPGVTWVHSRAAGVDRIVSALPPAGVTLTNSRGVYDASLAEFTAAAVLHFAKRVAFFSAAQREGVWRRAQVGMVRGRTVGVVGFGSIGQACARMLRDAFGMRVLALRRRADDDAGGLAERVFAPEAVCEMVAQSDVVLVTAALTPATRGLVSAAAIAAMRPDAVLINIARGPVVDADALLAALESGAIAGAALDVTDPEPLPDGHPLYAVDPERLLLTFHCGDNTPEHRSSAVDAFLANAGRFVRGEGLEGLVDVSRGY